jgi:hypothetical protein
VMIQVPITNSFTQAGLTKAIASISCQGNTNTAGALSEGLLQLNPQPSSGALNVMVLFTDGLANAATFNMPLSPQSTCTGSGIHASAKLPGFGQAYPYLIGSFKLDTVFNSFFQAWASPSSGGTMPTSGNSDNSVFPNVANCVFFTAPGLYLASDWAGLPPFDYYGNALNPSNPYQTVSPTVVASDGVLYDLSTITANIGATGPSGLSGVMLNAAVNAAKTARKAGVLIDAIGLGNAEGYGPLSVNEPFLEQIANTAASAQYDSTQKTGLYIYAENSSDLGAAFNQISVEILSLTK